MKRSDDAREVRANLDKLEAEMERAVLVATEHLPPDVVTLDSRVRVLDQDSGEELLFTVVLPSDEGRISVLAPLGMAVLGYRTGDQIEWEVPGGWRRLQVQEVLYQPEEAERLKAVRGSSPGLE